MQRASDFRLIKRFCDIPSTGPTRSTRASILPSWSMRRPGDSESTLHHRFAAPETPGGAGPYPTAGTRPSRARTSPTCLPRGG